MRYQKLIIGFIKLKLVTINYKSDSKTKQNAFSKNTPTNKQNILIKPTQKLSKIWQLADHSAAATYRNSNKGQQNGGIKAPRILRLNGHLLHK